MASHLDLQEQEQIDALRAFWNQYGNLLTWLLVLLLGAYAAWNGWQYHQADNGVDEEARVLARIRIAGLLLDAKKFDEALLQLETAKGTPFEALAADRRGDVLQAKGQKSQAITAFQSAWSQMPETLDYRQAVEAKLVALGAAPAASGARP